MTPSDNPPAGEVEMTLEERVEKVVRNHFYPGPVAGSTARLTKALIAEFGLSPQPSRPQGEGGWRPIEALPNDETLVLGYSAGGHMMVWKARTLKRNTAGPTPAHLNFQATHWKPLPAPPAALSNQGKPSS